jgi:hypothetical protein
MGARLQSEMRRLWFLAVLLCLWPLAAQAITRNPVSFIPEHPQKPSFSSRLERDGQYQERPSLLVVVYVTADGRIGIFCGGDPINGFDPTGRCFEKTVSAVGSYLYSGGSYGQEYRDASSILNYIGDNTDSPTLAGLMGFASYFTDKAANNVTPSYYVNQAVSDYNAAGGGVTGVLGVGNRYNPTASAYDFFSGYDLITGQTLSGVDRASAGLNTLGGALLLTAGAVDSFQPGTTPPVVAPQYYIENGVRRSVASLQAGASDIPATIYTEGQPPVTTTVPLNQLFSPKPEIPLDTRFLNIQPPIQTPIQLQPFGLPGQLPTVPINQVKLVPPPGGN